MLEKLKLEDKKPSALLDKVLNESNDKLNITNILIKYIIYVLLINTKSIFLNFSVESSNWNN